MNDKFEERLVCSEPELLEVHRTANDGHGRHNELPGSRMVDFSPRNRGVSEPLRTTRQTVLSPRVNEAVALSLQSCKRDSSDGWLGEESRTHMGDRRRHQRFVMSDACEGTFQLLEDVSIEEVTAEELLLLSAAPARPGEVVSVEIPGETGNGNAVFKGHVAESRPVMTDGTMRHRIVVKMSAADQAPEFEEALAKDQEQ